MEKDIIRRLKQRDEEAFNYIYKKYANDIALNVFNIVHNLEDAQDITQEIFLELFDKLNTFDETKSSFSTWFHCVAKNYALSYRRDNKVSEYYYAETIAQNYNKNDYTKELVFDDLEYVLTKKEFEVMVGKFVDGLTEKEIANKLGITKRMVKRYAHKSYDKIKVYLKGK